MNEDGKEPRVVAISRKDRLIKIKTYCKHEETYIMGNNIALDTTLGLQRVNVLGAFLEHLIDLRLPEAGLP